MSIKRRRHGFVCWMTCTTLAMASLVCLQLTHTVLTQLDPIDPSSILTLEGASPTVMVRTFPPNQPSKPLRLQVPFYVYQNATLNWQHFTFSQPGPNYEEFKHSDDLWLYRASMKHPMRTDDPTKAKLFFVPFFLNAVSERRTCLPLPGRNETRCFDRPRHAYRFADQQLALSPFFQRSQGQDHVLVISHWLAPPRKIPNLLRCNIINFEGRIPQPSSPNVSSLASFYVGRPCPPLNPTWTKTHDLVLIATFKPQMPEFAVRQNICQWLSDYNNRTSRSAPTTGSRGATDNTYSIAHCGPGHQCPAVAQAKYGFHPRGDTWGSNRVMDLFLSRTIPLFTDPQQYQVLPPLVPWRNLSYLINVTTPEAFYASLQSIVSPHRSNNNNNHHDHNDDGDDNDDDYSTKRRLIEDYMYLFDHTQIYQFDAYMAELAKRLSLQD